MQAIFIFNNLKVDTWNLNDAAFMGFDVLTWDNQSYVSGVLWDIGCDAGYTHIGLNNVYGQIWTTESLQAINELEYFVGLHSGLTESFKTKAIITEEALTPVEIDVSIYKLKEIKTNYQIVPDGKWVLKRV